MKLNLSMSIAVALGLFTGCGYTNTSDTNNSTELPTQQEATSISYIDYKGENRTAEASAGKAEYHTGTGYGNTLFDSADKKCQHCHNELYDTWQGSMHGKSWKDPIFQSKFQDFLRTHINKIGEDKTANGGLLYSEKKFKGVAQTCIKCHAPGAYYAGDFKVSLEVLQENATTENLNTAKTEHQSNLAGSFDASKETSVVATSHTSGKLYKATYQIGHVANTEGINCAFCHSIETPRLMKNDGMDNGEYTLAAAIRVGPHGPIKAEAGSTLTFDTNTSNPDMNKFFRLWGPEKYKNYAHTPKGGTAGEFDVNKSKDGRYTMHSIDLNGTGGKVHYTGGPYYGPFGVTGKTNENENDTTDRASKVNPHYDKENNNPFGNNGKGLCLSCHQRSAGASVPSGEAGAGSFMELCSTQVAVTTGNDTASNDSLSSPKCQKCHMERIEGTILHKWATPSEKWTLADNDHLTAEFNPDDTTVDAGDNPVRDGWLNSHAFLGASKTGQKTSVKAKIQSGFEGSIETSVSGNILTVTTKITNKTAHMFPGAHPMRRVLSRLIVTDGNGTKLDLVSSTGTSTFGDIQNSIQPLQGKTLHSSALSSVPVQNNGSEALSFPGKAPDLNGSTINSQKFDGQQVIISGTDYTIQSQIIKDGHTEGNVSNAAIASSSDASNFTRIYGHETGKKYNGIFVVRPGFDSNMVANDNRLSPNETETYTVTYDISGKTDITATYKVYYMQKGANGKFIAGEDGFLNQAKSDEKKLLVTEVGSYSKSI